VADHENRTFLPVYNPVDSRNIVGQRTKRILNGNRMQPSLREQGDDLCPARAVGKSSMHKHDSTDCHDAIPFAVYLRQTLVDLAAACVGIIEQEPSLAQLNEVKRQEAAGLGGLPTCDR
jgi:hypothetical protein